MNPEQQPNQAQAQPTPPQPVPPTQVQPMQQPTAPNTPPQAQAEDPGQVMGIISIVLSFFGLGLIGIILGVLSLNKSKAAGYKGTLGLVGTIIGIVFTVLALLYVIFIAVVAYNGIQDRAAESSYQQQSQTLAPSHQKFSAIN